MSNLSQKERSELEKKYGTIKEFCIGREVEKINQEDGSEKEIVIKEGHSFYLRRPDRATLKYALSKQMRATGETDMISPGEIIINKCWVAGDENIKNLDHLFFPACFEAYQYLQEIVGLY